MREQVEEVLDRVRVHLRVDGANVELLDIADGVITLRLTGGCMRCPMSRIALVSGLEDALRAEIAEVKKVVLVRV
jgi:Fe-S cluster biogenesis protein NfuA